MGLKFRRGTTAQKSGSLAFGEPYVNTTLGTLQVGGPDGDITLGSTGTGSTGTFGAISGSGLDITGNANIAGNLTLGGQLTIGDATSDTVNVVASLSSSLIPQTTNAFDLGSATKIWRDLYISTGSIKFVDGTTVVKEFNLESIEGLEAATGSSDEKFTQIGIITGSLITSASNFEQRISANETVSSSYARTNSTNTFTGTQNISGSLYITQDLVVFGSSSIENISASTLTLGTNRVILNTALPAIRYAGMSVYDSGSSGVSASILWDSQEDNFVFAHQSAGSPTFDSSLMIFGPLSTDGLGTEIPLTGNYIVKGGNEGHGHHITSSQIYAVDDLVSIGSNLVVTGSVTATTLVGSVSATNGVVSGSSQVSISSTTGFGTYIDQALLTTSSPTFAGLTVSGSIAATGDVVAYSTSDRRHKNNIVSISDALSKVTKLNGVTWEWNDDVDDITKQTPKTGLIAQEVQEVLPEVVKEREGGFLSLDYSKMMGLMVEAIKEQQTQIHALTLEIEELKKQKGL